MNPERISMPDIDIDFDDEGRDAIIKWVIEKYGQMNVAQIITTCFGRKIPRLKMQEEFWMFRFLIQCNYQINS